MTVKKVAITGGTHDNELTGIHLLKRWQKRGEEINFSTLDVSTLLTNPKAYENNRRYLDQDLNRRFALSELNNPNLGNYEATRAKVINQQLGPKEDPQTDFIIDLHTTTANMGVTIVINSLNPLVKATAFYIKQQLPNVTLFYQEVDRMADNFLISLGKVGGLIVEVGPIPQGLLRPDVFEQTRLATLAALEYLDLHNQGNAPALPETQPGFQFVEKVKLPEDDQGQLIGMVHPNIQDGDYQTLNIGDPFFLLETGEVIKYDGEQGLVPAFINEAAYYDQHHGLSLMRPIEISLK